MYQPETRSLNPPISGLRGAYDRFDCFSGLTLKLRTFHRFLQARSTMSEDPLAPRGG